MNKMVIPTYLEDFATYGRKEYFTDMKSSDEFPFEWRGQIKSSTGNKKLKIKYYGELFKPEQSTNYDLICDTDFAPEQILAIDPETSEKILLFDGCIHGFEAMFCEKYTENQRENRNEKTFYIDRFGCDTFDVIVKVYRNTDFEDEFGKEYQKNGKITLFSGDVITWEELLRDAFDFIEIRVINENGQETIISERELC